MSSCFDKTYFVLVLLKLLFIRKKIKYIFLVKYPAAKILFLTKRSLNDELMVGLGFIQYNFVCYLT